MRIKKTDETTAGSDTTLKERPSGDTTCYSKTVVAERMMRAGFQTRKSCRNSWKPSTMTTRTSRRC